MNTIRLNTVAALAVLTVMPPVAQCSDFTPAPAGSPYVDVQSVPSAVYIPHPAAAKSAPDQSFEYAGNTVKAMWDAARIRTNALSMEMSRTEMIANNDRVSFAIYAPMQTVNVALSIAGYVSQSRVDDSSVAWIQVLSLAAKQQVNTELKYSIKMNSHGNFDSFITYRLNSGLDANKAGMAAGLRYNIKF